MGTFEEAWLCFHSSIIWRCFAWGAESPPRDVLGLPLGSSGGYWISTGPGTRQNGRALGDRGRAPCPVPEPLPWPGGLAGNRCARGSVEDKVALLTLAGWWALGPGLLGHPGQQVLVAQVLGQKKGLCVISMNTRDLELLGTESEMEIWGCERGSGKTSSHSLGTLWRPGPRKGCPKMGSGWQGRQNEGLSVLETWRQVDARMEGGAGLGRLSHVFQKSVKVKESEVALLCLTLCDPMDWSLLGSSVRGIFQARILEWVAISFSRGSSRPRDWTRVFCIAGRHFTIWATWEGPPPCWL